MTTAQTNGTGRSGTFFDRLCRTLPGGNTRTATFFAPFPLALDRGEGAFVFDLDGNRYVDLVNNYTSLVHGHANPAVTAAIVREAERGTVFPAPIEVQADLAERIVERIASIDSLRFTNSGTEANMHALRCARAATGRSHVVKVHDGYHGSWDGLPSSLEAAAGIPAAVLDTIHWIDFNAIDQLDAVVNAHGDDIAAIILEPVLGAAVIPAEPAFLHAAQAAARRCGAVFILDEVVTLRLEYSGYQRRLDLTPDLTTLGKVIGGGLPVGAFGGRADLMALYDPREDGALTHQGTFNGNSLTMAAGVATLDLLTVAEIDRINALGAQLAAGLRTLIDDLPHSALITEDGSLVQVHFDVPAQLRRGADTNPRSPLLAAFHLAALDRGVYIAPRGELAISTAMDTDLIDDVLDRLGAALVTL